MTGRGLSTQHYLSQACASTLKLWDGLYHEIHNEPQKQEVLEFMINWLQAHVAEG